MRFYLENMEEYSEGLRLLLEERGHTLVREKGGNDIIVISPERWKQDKLSVSCSEGRLQVGFSQKTHFFRGVMKFLRDRTSNCASAQNHGQARGQDAQGDKYGFEEKAWFESNGAMLDCSRNGVLKVESVKEEIRRMAALGLNTLMLYTEETYEIKDYPYFGAFRGRYTMEELRECDAYAALFGIEMIPCIQTLAHLHTALRWRAHAELRDTEDILLADSEEVYRLIENMIRTVSACFRSRKIHLGMDEAHDLGLGRYLNEHGFQDRFSIMNRHLERVCGICREAGLEPTIWSDMYFRLQSPTGGYYDLPADEDLAGAPKPPADVCMMYWDYYNSEQKHYRDYFNLHRKMAEKTAFAGGAWIWNGLAPNYSKMLMTSRAALQACKETGIRNVICTFWQDNGAETPMEAGNPALVYFAESGFGEEPSRRETDAWLEFLWGDGLEGWELLDRFDCTQYASAGNLGEDNPSKFLFYQDVLLGLFDGQIQGLGLERHYSELAAALNAYLEEHGNASLLFDYYRTLAELLARKAELGIKLCDAYRLNDREALREMVEGVLPECILLAGGLLEQRRRLWFNECKPFGFEVLDIRFAGVKARLESAVGRLREYLDGETDSLPELEEARLRYVPQEGKEAPRLCSCNLWQNIVSAANIAGV